MNQEQLKSTYKHLFETDNGKVILKDLENVILTSSPFMSNDIPTDALLREGARHLINLIYCQLGKD